MDETGMSMNLGKKSMFDKITNMWITELNTRDLVYFGFIWR